MLLVLLVSSTSSELICRYETLVRWGKVIYLAAPIGCDIFNTGFLPKLNKECLTRVLFAAAQNVGELVISARVVKTFEHDSAVLEDADRALPFPDRLPGVRFKVVEGATFESVPN
jgi:hypothetical protein